MARSWFGGDSGSFVIKLYTLGSSKLMAVQDAAVEIWSDFAAEGGAQLTDLLDKNGTAITVPDVTSSGQVVAFQGPDAVNDRVLATADHGATGVWLLNTDGLPAADARDAAQAAQTGAEQARDEAQRVAGQWAATTAYAADQVVLAPDGTLLSRLADGTSRATFDATEQAAWVAVSAKDGTIEKQSLNAAIDAAQLAPSFKIADRTEAAGRALLQPWYGALGMRYAQPANVVVLGDSWTEGHGATALDRRFVARTRDSIRKALGITGGAGYIQPDFNSGDSFASPWTFNGTHSSTSTSFGPCRWVQLLNSGATAEITVHGTSLDVMYGKGGTAQSFTVTVDGGAPTTVTANTGGAFTDGQLSRISLGASGDHTVVITASGTQAVLDGIIVYDGDEDAGVRVHACGHYGFTSADWLSPNTNNLKVAVANMTPHLLVVEDMLNDYNSSVAALTAAEMQANLSTLVTDIRTQIGSRTVPVVFLAAPQPKDNTFTPPNDPWQSYVDALYALADSLPNAVVWDAGQRINSYTSGNRYSMWNDSLHLNDVGHSVLGDALARFLLPA